MYSATLCNWQLTGGGNNSLALTSSQLRGAGSRALAQSSATTLLETNLPSLSLFFPHVPRHSFWALTFCSLLLATKIRVHVNFQLPLFSGIRQLSPNLPCCCPSVSSSYECKWGCCGWKPCPRLPMANYICQTPTRFTFAVAPSAIWLYSHQWQKKCLDNHYHVLQSRPDAGRRSWGMEQLTSQ